MKILLSYKNSFYLILVIAITSIVALNYRILFDYSKPVLKIEKLRQNLSKKTIFLGILAQDNLSGLNSLTIRTYLKSRITHQITIPLNGSLLEHKKIEIPLDKVRHLDQLNLELILNDTSLFSNQTIINQEILIDATAPKIKLVSARANIYQGSIEPVIYQASDNQLKTSGVKIGSKFFLGYPIELIDPTLGFLNTKFAFYYVTPEADPDSEDQNNALIIARDTASNKSSLPFDFKFFRKRAAKQRITLEDQQLSQLLTKLSTKQIELIPQHITAIEQSNRDLIFKRSKKYHAENYLDKAFLSASGSVQCTFNSQLEYYSKNKELLFTLVSQGINYLTGESDNITSLAPGKVILNQKLPLWGKTIVIYHGLGITTVYASLSDQSVELEQIVESGAVIGKSGKLIIRDQNGYILESLLSNQSFNPGTLWDNNWFKDHYLDKIEQVKNVL